jgi:hypothetical protein
MDFVAKRVLQALLLQSRDNRPISAASLAAMAGVTPTRAATALCTLELAGLANASRARLTMLGLVAALAQDGTLGGAGAQAGTSRALRPYGRPKRHAQCPWAARDAGRGAPAHDALFAGLVPVELGIGRA